MTDLLTALQSAERGSRELDANVYEWLGYEVKRQAEWRGGRRFSRAYAFLRWSRWEAMDYLTTSMNAALELVNRELPGWSWQIDIDPGEVTVQGAPERWTEGLAAPDIGGVHVTALTPPLALVIALVRAKEASDEAG